MPRRLIDYQNITLILSGLFIPNSDLGLWTLAVSTALAADIIDTFRVRISG